MKTCFNEGCAMRQSTLEKDLELCEKAGFDFIEIRLDMLFDYLQTHTIEDLKSFFATHHLKPHAINQIYLHEDFLTERDDHEKGQELFQKFIYSVFIAKEIGAPSIVVVSTFTDDGSKFCAEWLNRHYNGTEWLNRHYNGTEKLDRHCNGTEKLDRHCSKKTAKNINNENSSSEYSNSEYNNSENKSEIDSNIFDFEDCAREHAINNHVRILKKLGELAKPYGVTIALELVGMEKAAIGDIDAAREVIERVDMDNVGYAMDIINIYIKNHDEKDFEKLRDVDVKKIFAFHVNNTDNPEILVQAERTLPDRGVLDAGHVIEILKEIGYEDMLSVETFRPEYYDWPAEKVVDEAYRSVKAIM